MKGEKKKTFTYATYPSKKDKASRLAEKEGSTLSEKIDELLDGYIRYGSFAKQIASFDSSGTITIKESNKKKK